MFLSYVYGAMKNYFFIESSTSDSNTQPGLKSLFEFIKLDIQRYVALAEEYGKDDPMVKHLCAQIYGMQMAFEIVAGISYTDYLINSTKLMMQGA